jgi:Peptidase inhibitor I78 family
MFRAPNRLSLVLALLIAGCAPQPAADDDAATEPGQRPAVGAGPTEPAMSDPPVVAPPAPPPAEETAMCDVTKAQFAVGQTYSDALAEQARAAAGAKIVRRLVPGQMVTMEFSAERLNLETDGSGKVAAVRCG